MKNEYKITTKSYKEPQQLKNWEDRIVYKSCRTYSKKDYKKIEFYLDNDFKILHCLMEERTSKKPYLKETSISFVSEEWAKKQEENPVEHRYYSVKVVIDDKFQTVLWYRDKNFEIPLEKEVLFRKDVPYSEEDVCLIGYTHYDIEGNLISPEEYYKDIQPIADYMIADEINKQYKYESITKKALELFNKKQTAKLIEFYNNKVTSITDRIEALGILLTAVAEKENWDCKKVFKFRENILKSHNNDFIYLFDNAMFQAGVNSPEEFVQSIEEGIKKQIPMAYVIKSFFYYYGLEEYFHSIQAIEKAILLEPTNLEYKRLRQNLENEYNGMS